MRGERKALLKVKGQDLEDTLNYSISYTHTHTKNQYSTHKFTYKTTLGSLQHKKRLKSLIS